MIILECRFRFFNSRKSSLENHAQNKHIAGKKMFLIKKHASSFLELAIDGM